MLSCRSAIDSYQESISLSVSHRQPHQHIINPAKAFYPLYRLGLIVRVPKEIWRDYGIYEVMRYWFGRIPTKLRFSHETFTSATEFFGFRWQIFCGTAPDAWLDGPAIRPIWFLDFCMSETGVTFLFYLSHFLAPRNSEQMGGWSSFFTTSQRFRRTILGDTCLCSVIALEWNGFIFHHGMAIAWAGTVKKIPFSLCQLCH